jgi:hypothetical protein
MGYEDGYWNTAKPEERAARNQKGITVDKRNDRRLFIYQFI